jgi:HlyD family secretion protein
LKVAHSEIAAATAALSAARAKEADTIVVSPIDGFIVSRDLEPGAAVGAGTSILKVADPRTGWATVFVDEREAGPLFVGDASDVSLRSQPGKTFRGKVARIRSESDRVTEQRVFDITLNEPPSQWTLGEQVEATIRAAAKRITALPLGAVVRTPDGTGAWMIVDGRLRFREARFGLLDPDGWIEVLDGLSPGEHVVLAPGALGSRESEGRRVRDITQSLQAAVTVP